MWYGLILTQNPGLMTERRILLDPLVHSTSPDLASRLLLKELEMRSENGWQLFSVQRQVDGKRIWSLVDENGKVSHIEIESVPNIEALLIFCS